MNKSPLNYLITIAFGIILWVVTAIFYGGNFSESLILAKSTPEGFLSMLRIMLGIATVFGISLSVYWYYFGNLNSTAGALNRASRVWWVSFIVEIIASLALLFALVMLNLSEGIQTKDWIITFLMLSVHTWIFYWLCTYLMSPRTVKYIPLFK